MNVSKSKDLIIVLIGILWIACIVLGTMGHFVVGMCLGVVLMFLHMVLGTAKNGVVPKGFLVYPMVLWGVLWLASFILSGYYGSLFAGAQPTFTVLGLHPSFAPTIFLYWIGGQLTLNLGFYLRQDEWLSEKEWNAFCEKVRNLEVKGAC